MITLITGQPGHGKTQYAIAEALKAKEGGRLVYAGNIKGLDYQKTGFVKLDSFEQWQDCEDGAVILWDECYDAIPQRGPGRKVPEHVEALARHRHRGFDFFLVCQQPNQLDSFVGGLIEVHKHLRRKWMTPVTLVKSWDRWERDPIKTKGYETHTWKLDKRIWGLYESATQHTGKVRPPQSVVRLVLVSLLVLGAIIGAYNLVMGRVSEAESAGQVDHATDPGALRYAAPAAERRATGAGRGVDTMRQTDPLTYLRPRIPAMPWTAPAYDDVPLAPPPRVACMSSDKKCGCIKFGNGQSVRIVLDDELCRIIAKEGIYDPTWIPPQQHAPPPTIDIEPPRVDHTAVIAGGAPYIGPRYQSPDPRANL